MCQRCAHDGNPSHDAGSRRADGLGPTRFDQNFRRRMLRPQGFDEILHFQAAGQGGFDGAHAHLHGVPGIDTFTQANDMIDHGETGILERFDRLGVHFAGIDDEVDVFPDAVPDPPSQHEQSVQIVKLGRAQNDEVGPAVRQFSGFGDNRLGIKRGRGVIGVPLGGMTAKGTPHFTGGAVDADGCPDVPPPAGKFARHGIGAFQKMINPFVAHPRIEEQFRFITGREDVAVWGIMHGRSRWLHCLSRLKR